jgi:hypothetical protein
MHLQLRFILSVDIKVAAKEGKFLANHFNRVGQLNRDRASIEENGANVQVVIHRF